jgi:hypothetical protein
MARFGSGWTEGVLGFGHRNALVALLLVSGSINLGLAHRLNYLAARNESPLVPGTRVPPISGESMSGLVTITYPASQPMVLYYFSPDCGWCKRNWGNVGALANSVQGRFRLVALSTLPRIAEEVRNRLSGFEVLWNFSQDVRSAYRLGGTPMTVVVGTDGRVLKAWSGAFQGRVEREIESFFSVDLPGLTR